MSTTGRKSPAAQKRVRELVENVEDLIEMRESVEQIGIKLGRTPAALARALYRAQRPELARVFGNVAQRGRVYAWTPARMQRQRTRRAAS